MDNMVKHLEEQKSILDLYCSALNLSIKRMESRLKKQELFSKKKATELEEEQMEIANEIDQLIAKAQKVFQPECQNLISSKPQKLHSTSLKIASVRQSVDFSGKELNDPKFVQKKITKSGNIGEKDHLSQNKMKNITVKNSLKKNPLKNSLKKHMKVDIPSKTKSYDNFFSSNSITPSAATSIMSSASNQNFKQKLKIVEQPITTVGDSQIISPESERKLTISSTGNSEQVLSQKDISPDSVNQKANILNEESNSIKANCYNEKILEKLFDEEFKSFYDKSFMLEKVIDKLECSPILLSERKNAVKEFMDGLNDSCSKEILESGKRVSESFPLPYEFGETVCQEIIEDLSEASQRGQVEQVEILRRLDSMIRIEQLNYKKNFANFVRKMAEKNKFGLTGQDR